MTAIAVRAPARELPGGGPFYSEYGSFPFQADEVASIIENTAPGHRSGHVSVFDTGMGKTIISLAAGAFLFDEGEIDQMVVIAELNTIDDWREATETFTNLSAFVYHGPKRQENLARHISEHGWPHVFVTTYETGSRELMAWSNPEGRKGRKGRRNDGPLLGQLALRERRNFWVFDEVIKLKSRMSFLHKAFDYVLTQLRRTEFHQRVLGLTATPMTANIQDGFNIGLVVCPERMPSIGQFERDIVRGWDEHGAPIFDEDSAAEFSRYFRGITSRKRKTDPDVALHFPRQHERARHVDTEDFAGFYDSIATIFDPPEDALYDPRNSRQVMEDEQKLWTLLRMSAGHPASHLHASNATSRSIADEIGAEALRAIGAPKVPVLLNTIAPYRQRGWPVVVFSFYRTILTELERELTEAGISSVLYHGGLTRSARSKVVGTFKAGHTEVLLASDAAAKGMNLQVSPAVVEYESALTFANRTQRINRVHRLTSPWSDVYCTTLIASDTIEDGIANLVMKRNAAQDILLGDDEDGSGFVSAAQRRALLNIRTSGRQRAGRAA